MIFIGLLTHNISFYVSHHVLSISWGLYARKGRSIVRNLKIDLSTFPLPGLSTSQLYHTLHLSVLRCCIMHSSYNKIEFILNAIFLTVFFLAYYIFSRLQQSLLRSKRSWHHLRIQLKQETIVFPFSFRQQRQIILSSTASSTYINCCAWYVLQFVSLLLFLFVSRLCWEQTSV